MLGIISVTGSKTRLEKVVAAGDGFEMLSLKSPHLSKRWVKRLAAINVARAAVSSQLGEDAQRLLLSFGIVPVSGQMLLRRIAPQIALFALEQAGILVSQTGAEIYSSGKSGYSAVAALSAKMRYVSAIGRGSELLRDSARRELGVSLVSGRIPRFMCENILRLYFDGREELFSVETHQNEKFFKSAEITLPERFNAIADGGCALSVGEALVQCGKMQLCELEIKSVQLS